MPKPSNPFNYTTQDYWIAHMELIRVLAVLGIDWPVDMRVETFWLYDRLPKVYGADNDPRLIEDAQNLVNLLVQLRKMGLEPKHEKGRYTK